MLLCCFKKYFLVKKIKNNNKEINDYYSFINRLSNIEDFSSRLEDIYNSKNMCNFTLKRKLLKIKRNEI